MLLMISVSVMRICSIECYFGFVVSVLLKICSILVKVVILIIVFRNSDISVGVLLYMLGVYW